MTLATPKPPMIKASAVIPPQHQPDALHLRASLVGGRGEVPHAKVVLFPGRQAMVLFERLGCRRHHSGNILLLVDLNEHAAESAGAFAEQPLLRRREWHVNHVVRVVAEQARALRLHDARDREQHRRGGRCGGISTTTTMHPFRGRRWGRDADLLANDSAAGEQVLGNGRAEHGRCRARAFVLRGEETALGMLAPWTVPMSGNTPRTAVLQF